MFQQLLVSVLVPSPVPFRGSSLEHRASDRAWSGASNADVSPVKSRRVPSAALLASEPLCFRTNT